MNACKMNVFDKKEVFKSMNKYGMLDNNATVTPTDNDTWYYTMGHRDFPAGMFLDPSFMFRQTNLKNKLQTDSMPYFDSEGMRLWSGGSRYSPNGGWSR